MRPGYGFPSRWPTTATSKLSIADHASRLTGCDDSAASQPRWGRPGSSSSPKHGSDLVVAYYAWCMDQVGPAEVPERLGKGTGRYPQPVTLLARLVVTEHEGRGLGAGLIQEVFARSSSSPST